jgi:hypothetical protein
MTQNICLFGVWGKEGNGKMRASVEIIKPDFVIFNFELCTCPIDRDIGRWFMEHDLSEVFEVTGCENIRLAFKQVHDALQSPDEWIYPPEMIAVRAEWNKDWW